MLFSSFPLLVFAVFQSLLGFVTATQCYWPNGKPAGDNWTPCGDSKVCCAAGEACLSNKLCFGSNLNAAYRGACADKSWPLAECPRICYDRKSSPSLSMGSAYHCRVKWVANARVEVQDSHANLYPCPNNTNEVFTCGSSGWASEVCEKDLEQIPWPQGGYVSYAMVNETGSAAKQSSNPSRPTVTETVTATETAAASKDNQSVALGAGLGVGLGVPLLLVSAALVGFWVRARRQIQRMQESLQQQQVLLASRGAGAVYEAGGEQVSRTQELDGMTTKPQELEG